MLTTALVSTACQSLDHSHQMLSSQGNASDAQTSNQPQGSFSIGHGELTLLTLGGGKPVRLDGSGTTCPHVQHIKKIIPADILALFKNWYQVVDDQVSKKFIHSNFLWGAHGTKNLFRILNDKKLKTSYAIHKSSFLDCTYFYPVAYADLAAKYASEGLLVCLCMNSGTAPDPLAFTSDLAIPYYILLTDQQLDEIKCGGEQFNLSIKNKIDKLFAIENNMVLDQSEDRETEEDSNACTLVWDRSINAFVRSTPKLPKQDNYKETIPEVIASITNELKRSRVDIAYQDKEGNTLVSYAVAKGNVEIVKTLLNDGYNVGNMVGNMLLNFSEKTPCINVLDIQNNKGVTPLMIAVENKNAAIVKALLDYSLKPTIGLTNNEGKTALALAQENNDQTIIALLEA